MTDRLEIAFAPLSATPAKTACYFAGESRAFTPAARDANKRAGGALERAAEAAGFKGAAKTTYEVLGAAQLDATRVLVVGTGPTDEHNDNDWAVLGGYAFGQITARKTEAASIFADVPAGNARRGAEVGADIAFGALLRSYKFRKYQTRSKSEGEGAANSNGPNSELERLTIHCADPAAAEAQFARRRAIAHGVFLARDLVNEPANVLGPVEFADRASELQRAGIEVEILDVDAMKALKMDALLGVGQGSVRPSRIAVMQWHGGPAGSKASKRAKPLCFVGKGVTFDTGGISMKPAAGMEDMKGDMGGAACVTGLMLALAERKAAVHAVGLIGLVENMPSGSAQRPGDIVTSMSGQTIEVLNTDAEGRLVLADVLWYAQERFKPKLIVDLATLTGAIMVALGKEHAGLFSNDDKLADDLAAAGKATGELVWRMPLAKAYDKLIDSRTADMKNIGGRFGGAITAAQFLQRFIKKDTPWAHLDVAGVAMDSNKTEISQGWASGWGVRLLDQLVAEKHEKAEK